MSYKKTVRALVCVAVMFVPGFIHAQDAKPARPASVYKIDYVFSELQNDKRMNTRSYTVLVGSTDRGSIRLGNRFPVWSTTKDGSNSFSYIDLGVNIDSRVEDIGLPDSSSAVALYTTVEMTSIAPDQHDTRSDSPIVRQIKFQNQNVIPLGKQVLLSSADEIDGTRRLQVEVTATKIR